MRDRKVKVTTFVAELLVGDGELEVLESHPLNTCQKFVESKVRMHNIRNSIYFKGHTKVYARN